MRRAPPLMRSSLNSEQHGEGVHIVQFRRAREREQLIKVRDIVFHRSCEQVRHSYGMNRRESLAMPGSRADQQTVQQAILQRQQEVAGERIAGALHVSGKIREWETRAEEIINRIVLQQVGKSLSDNLIAPCGVVISCRCVRQRFLRRVSDGLQKLPNTASKAFVRLLNPQSPLDQLQNEIEL